MEWITENWQYIAGAMAVASIIVNLTPNETDNKYYAMVLKVLNGIAVNINVKGIGNK